MSESMQGLKRTHYCTELSAANVGEEVVVTGWVQRRRDKGQLLFILLRDRSGLLQLSFGEHTDEEVFEKAKKLRSEYVVAARGIVLSRGADANKTMQTGDIEIDVKELRILSEAETTPFEIVEKSDTKEELRLKYRYLDLRRPDMQNNLILRSKVAQSVRRFLEEEGFLEIETPIMQKSTPEGARDYLVPSRVHPGHFYALPQSPQLFKQLLMVAGYDRYFQIAKCFRDEDLRADRQPEFTQIDMELSFVEPEDVMCINERLIQRVFKDALDVEVALPIQRMTYKEAMDRFGSDKPDLRFGVELKDLTEIVKGCGFAVFENVIANGGTVRAINAKGMGDLGRKQIDALVKYGQDFGAKGVAWHQIKTDGEEKSSFAKFLSEETLGAIKEKMGADKDDLILVVADKPSVVFGALGALRLEVARKLELINQDEFRFVWITEFPLLEYDEEAGRYVAMHHPFTMPMNEDLELMETNPGAVRAKAYDLALNGCELGGGSIRIYQRDVQKRMFNLLGFTNEEAEERFGFLLNAFKYGVPPHGGLAFGLDRMIMLMCKADSIRDVIAFPKVKDASCLMTEAPGAVDAKQLEELELIIKETNDEA
ncbi:aspartate--tRNA ligase [Sporanaerobium hydrogeniformans]|uniref:Aspartate--tRNA ligase n=1 Tax=Sporanaerobium hydrogeniformans TaxID=3072179 RepID=A0AC61DE00_9FIRM|nr:aspartate--tRNA ligase [Sporanaerobium hydrogeniformans]PHV70971.1 aspartate--tRNA ligase [Sporanaerobium hydrogeniformans]